MPERVFVISDLHLGGAPGANGRPSFEMCRPEARRRLAGFFAWAAAQRTPDRAVRLVIAGDLVDFLAEEDDLAEHGYRAFTHDEALACQKLTRIFERTSEVWDGLAAALPHVRLSVLVGNHDVELAFPAVRRALRERLGDQPFELLHNGEALALGPVLVDHGNRCDPWNQIDHDALRELCSELSRRERPKGPLETPGSELVARVMNKLKPRYAFVDLLKPETSAVLPLLAVFEPRLLCELKSCADIVRRRAIRRVDADGKPRDRRNIGAADDGHLSIEGVRHADGLSGQTNGLDEDVALACDLAGIDSTTLERDGREIGARDVALGWLDAMRAARDRQAQRPHVERLVRALQRLNRDDASYHVNREQEAYLAAARAAASRGFTLVLFGHTHLVKRVALDGGARYLNTGTWADVMRLPDTLLAPDAASNPDLLAFVDDLDRNDVVKRREQHPTFAQIDYGDGDRVDGDVYWFWSETDVKPVPDGVLPRRRKP